jgi:hypothetical protein
MKRLTVITLLATALCAACIKSAVNDVSLNYSFSLLNQSAVLSTEAASGAPVAAGSNGSINWTSATVNITQAEFSASHAGSTTALTSSNLYGINPFRADSLSGTVAIPSGVYENVRFKITMNESNVNPPMVLNGTYTEASGTKIPVVVTLNSVMSFVKEAERIEITSGKYIAKVTIELNALVKGLTASDFGQTTRTGANNTIMVNYNTNRALYDKLKARFPNTISIKVSK